MSHPCVDQTDDISGQETHLFLLQYPQPATIAVKSASDSIPTVFADAAGCKFPCNTAADVWLSTLFFLDKHASLPPAQCEQVSTNLATYASYFRIEPEIEGLLTKWASDHMSTEPVVYALKCADENGVMQNHWPLRNTEEVKLAAQCLLKYRNDFDFDMRKEAAQTILRVADNMSGDLPEAGQLRKIAGHGTCDIETLVNSIRTRADVIRKTDADVGKEMDKLATEAIAKSASTRLPENLEKMAALLDQADNRFGLDRAVVGYPEDNLFGITLDDLNHVKQAYAMFANGSVYAKVDLERLTASTLQEWFGDAFCKRATIAGLYSVDADTLAQLVAELPEDSQAMFNKMAASVNVFPVMEAPADRVKLPLAPENLMQWAS